MAEFPVPGLRLRLDEEVRWRQKRPRTDPGTFREEEIVNRFYQQEFVAEEVHNEEFGEDYGVEDDNLGFHGDYREDSEDDCEQEGNDDEDFHEYDGEDEAGVLPQGEDDGEIQENNAEEDIGEERQEQQHEERRDEAGETESVSVTIIDADALDCPICYKPLIIPIFQCGNGHVACPSCRTKLNNICASCQYPIEYRSRVMEKVLESAQAKCKNAKYGCEETVNYSKKQEHENTCLYDPCSCPVSGCNFVGLSIQLYQHFNVKHKNSAVGFSNNSLFHITAKVDDKYIILQEEKDKVLVIINNSQVEGFGNVLTASCIASNSDELILDYNIQARDSSRVHWLKFRSVTASIQKLDDKHSPTRFLLVPSNFFSYNGQLELDICINILNLSY